jgi:hypothetical protein
MIEPIISLAFSIHANKGVYAVLLGSGVSRSAGIPTGWEVLEDLIGRVAHLYGEECAPDPETWFRNKFGSSPNYSKMLKELAKTEAERNQILRGYFEATEEERGQGKKVPTPAHHAIAGLVASGHVRVIVTTNFDRLMESALEAAGIRPSVIDTPDKIEAAMPLAHSPCTVIKLHGDYMDIRIKNTPEELAEYDERMNKVLDRVLDEYGLVVCGWSADYDMALEAAIARCPSRRFTTYWTHISEPKDAAKRLIDFRRAEKIKIDGADPFFRELAEKVSALEEFDRPHPLSVKMAVAAEKKYLEEEKYRIRLYDLVTKETNRLLEAVSPKRFPARPTDKRETQNHVFRYEAATEVLLGLVATACFWSDSYRELWSQVIRRVANPPRDYTGTLIWDGLRWYPALLLIYGGGVASVAARRWENLNALLRDTEIRVFSDGKVPAAAAIYTGTVFEGDSERYLPEAEEGGLVANKHLFRVLRQPLADIIPHDEDYLTHFLTFEYLYTLTHADLRSKEFAPDHFWGPKGLFMSEDQYRSEQPVLKAVRRQAGAQGDEWPPLKAGLFGGSYERFEKIAAGVDESLRISTLLRP